MLIKIYVVPTVLPFLACNCLDSCWSNGQRRMGLRASERLLPTEERDGGRIIFSLLFLPLHISLLGLSHRKFRKPINCRAQIVGKISPIYSFDKYWLNNYNVPGSIFGTVDTEVKAWDQTYWEMRRASAKHRSYEGSCVGSNWFAALVLEVKESLSEVKGK